MVSLPLNCTNCNKYEMEKNRIVEIGRINGYAESTVHHIIDKHEVVYRDCDYQMVNRNMHSVQKMIGSAKDNIPDLLRSGTYEIGCQNGCPFKYNGKTERNPTVRYDEHDYCVVKNDHKSAVAEHMNDYKHETDISKVKLIQPVSGRNTCVFDCYEKIQIIKNRRVMPLMNQSDGNVNSVLFDLV